MKTRSMNLFDYLFLSALILELFTVIAGWDYLAIVIESRVWIEAGVPETLVSGIAPSLIAIGFILSFMLWAFISQFRLSPFRYILAICVAFEVWSVISGYLDPQASVWILVSDGFAAGLKIAATFMVFRSDADAWLRREV